MKRCSFSFILSALLILFLFSCREGSETTGKKTDPATVNALAETQALNDSCSKAWKMMIESDDQKIKDALRLLQEISYIPGHNESEVQRLSALLKELPAKRYTPSSMTSENIDVYDQATDTALQQVFELKRNTKGVENYTLTSELEASIREADGMVVNYRVLYDRWAQQYNASLEKIKALPEAEKLNRKMTFQL